MSFHKDLRGDDLHPPKIETVTTDPTGARVPQYEGEAVVDSVTDTLYVAIGATSADWKSFSSGAGGGITEISAADDVNTAGRADGNILVWDNAASEHVYEAPTASTTPDHNDLNGLDVGDFQHLTQAEHDNLTGATPELPTLKVGDVGAGNFIEFDTEGYFRFNGTTTVWDDLRVPVTSATANGSNPPTYSLFVNDGAAASGTTKALSFTSNSAGVGSIPNDVSYDFEVAHTIEFWFRPTPSTNQFNDIITKGAAFTYNYWGSSNVYVTYGGMGGLTSTVSLNVGSWNHILATYTPGSPNTLNLFINGNAAGTMTSGGGPTNNTDPIQINADTIIFDIDEFAIWDTVLNSTEIADRYNSGAGTGLLGTETDLIGLWKLEESTGSAIPDATTNSNDGTISGTENTHFEWIDGHVGAPAVGSLGVILPFFSASTRNELYFTAQMPHAWAEGTDIEPHVHWIPPTDGAVGEKVVWGLEYTWSNVLDVFGTSTIITGDTIIGTDTFLNENKHYVTDLGTISGTGKTLSSMLVCRVFRDAENVEDTYGDFAGLLEIDIHYQVDSLGSQEEFTKT
jgi:hypothetical protein